MRGEAVRGTAQMRAAACAGGFVPVEKTDIGLLQQRRANAARLEERLSPAATSRYFI